jgi:hypothetical protein
MRGERWRARTGRAAGSLFDRQSGPYANGETDMKSAACLLIVLATFSSHALAADKDRAEAKGDCSRILAKTIFVPDKTGARHDGTAKRLSEAHKNAQEEGWDFADLDVYTENGDLQGFFVTYTRPNPCNQAP